jgi:TM2 domain-containing membrane protein YozV
MNKFRLESRIRNVGIAYVLLFFAGAHYAYLNKWGTQIIFWITFGGFGIWWLIDVFRLARMVEDFNDPIFDELEWMEEEEREWERESFMDLDDRYMKRKEQRFDYRF